MVRNTIKGLVDNGHHVSVFTLNSKNGQYGFQYSNEADELAKKVYYRSVDVKMKLSFWDMLMSTAGNEAYTYERFYNLAFERLLIHELKLIEYDIIQFEGIFMSAYLPVVRKHSKAKLVYRAHNIEYMIWQRISEQKADPFKKYYLRKLANRIKNFELKFLNTFDAIISLTNQDMEQLHQLGANIPIEVHPVGIDLNRYQPDYRKTEYPSLFFLGALDWLPNREGMEWFLNSFFNDIAEGDLRVKLYVGGHNIPDSFDDFDALGKIFIQGEVDDALEFVNSKAIMIVPLLSGGGMRVKIVEGMAMQKCIIATALGAEGINYTNGHDIVIANNREEFYEAIKHCIADEDYCKSIGQNARALVEREHDTGLLTAKLLNFYVRLLNGTV